MRRRHREATANDPNSLKQHHRKGYLDTVRIKPVISLTHNRTEGRAPVWGSEFTSQVAPKGEFGRIFS